MNLRKILCHVANPLHVYCRLRDMGIPKLRSRRLAAVWERCVARPLGVVSLAVLLLTVVAPASALAKHLHLERAYQQVWCERQQGAMEVRLPGGLRIDCETATHAVEVDFAAKWAEAVGQALAYGAATGKRPGILLILEKPSDETHLAKLRSVITTYALPVDIWLIEPGEVGQ